MCVWNVSSRAVWLQWVASLTSLQFCFMCCCCCCHLASQTIKLKVSRDVVCTDCSGSGCVSGAKENVRCKDSVLSFFLGVPLDG